MHYSIHILEYSRSTDTRMLFHHVFLFLLMLINLFLFLFNPQVVHAHSNAGEEPETKVLLFGGFGGEAGSLRFFGDLLCFDPCDLGGNRRKRNRYCILCRSMCSMRVVCV
jgi:hypothetical protein